MIRVLKSYFVILLLLNSVQLLPSNAADNSAENIVIQLTIDGAIGPATTDYIQRSFELARKRNAAIILIRIDTPGGLDSAMRNIIKVGVNSGISDTQVEKSLSGSLATGI